MVFPGDAGVSRGLVPVDKNNLAPRLGLAWDPRGDGRLSVRAAYGLFYEDFRSDIWTYPAVNQPFVIREFINNPFSLSDPYRGRVNPFPYIYTPGGAKFSLPMGLFTVPAPVITSPYVHQMSFREVATNSNSSYHSLILSMNRRFSNGLTFLSAYTLGKFLDYYSAQNLGQTPQDPYNDRADRSRSDEDRRHVWVSSFVYEIPVLKSQKGILGRVLGGWEISGVVHLTSGLPVWVRSDRDNSLTGVGFDRPDLVGNPVRSHADRNDMVNRFFNTAAFAPNQPGSYGNAGR